MNFFRCNKCYEPFKLSDPPFSLTQCGHLFCNKCIGKDKQCFECKSTGVESLPMTQPLPDRVATLFVPTADVFEQALFTFKFQHAQMMISMRRFGEIEKKYNGMKMAYWKLRKHNEELTKAYRQLRERAESQLNRNVPAGQFPPGFVNIPRSYFAAANQHPNISQRNNMNRPSQMIGNQPGNGPTAVRFNTNNTCHGGYQTDDSMNSMGHCRTSDNNETPPITPDVGIFRIPNVRHLPRSVGTSSRGNSAHSGGSTPMSHNKMF